jgi:2-polyprenyl-3-methyl-5-hydroxy-6-metoxy-1,4-benzoquinol methylase
MDFYQALSEYYDEIFPLKEAQRTFLNDYLKRESLSSVLDIGCGTGTFALELSFRGAKVLGIDLSDKMVEISKKKAQEKENTAEFTVGDMRDLSGIQEQFDGIVCLGNTLAHVFGECELKQVLAQFRDKGSYLLIQTVNYDRILANHVKELPIIKTANLIFYRFYNYRPDNRIDFSMKIELLNTHEVLSGVNMLFPLKLNILKTALLDTGWEISNLWGNFNKETWTIDSTATVIEAKRISK